MALLYKDREGASDVAAQLPGDGTPVTVVHAACHACGAGMKPGQDWCLECGTAAPGRLGAKPGWRAAFTVVAVTLLLVVGAVAASYAALTSDAERKAAAPSAGSGEPIVVGPTAVVPVTPVTPGATGPGTTPPPVTAAPPTGTPIIPVTPPKQPANTPVTPPGPPATKTPPVAVKPPAAATGAKPAEVAAPKPEVIAFKRDAASTYDPGKRAGAEFGPASSAVDKSKKTVWDITVPADDKPIAAGLLIDLGKPYALRAIKLATPTADFDMELYGAASAKDVPPDILDKRWEHLTDIDDVADGDLVSLVGKSKNKHELLLLYITIPADPSDPRVAIGDVMLAGTP